MRIHIIPKHIAGQMIAVLSVSFILLLGTMAMFEFLESDSAVETAESEFTTRRLARLLPILQSIPSDQMSTYLGRISHCHDGYGVSEAAYSALRFDSRTIEIARNLAVRLSLEESMLEVGYVKLQRNDFSYQDCNSTEMSFPIDGMVISLRIHSDRWVNVEVHPHEWHVTPEMTDWITRSLAAFLVI